MVRQRRPSLSGLRDALAERAQGLSELTGEALVNGWEMHHRRAGGKGGTRRADQHTLPNVVALNPWEHQNHDRRSVHANVGGWARRGGWLLPLEGPYSHPELVPLWYQGLGWRYLTSAGLVLSAEAIQRLVLQYGQGGEPRT